MALFVGSCDQTGVQLSAVHRSMSACSMLSANDAVSIFRRAVQCYNEGDDDRQIREVTFAETMAQQRG